MHNAAQSHRFRVHARQFDAHHARVLVETSFEAAAVAYVEDLAPAGDADQEISVIVHNLDDGREHCFKIDLQTGEAGRLRLTNESGLESLIADAAAILPPKGRPMAYRPSWQGHLRLSLVTCPVALYTATSAGGDVHFNLINPKTNNRIKMITTDPDTGPIERSALVKGYEISKGEYVLLTEDEIKSVKLESTKTIDIERFVAKKDIDRLYWDNPYFLAPDGKMAQETFGVIRTAMEKSGQIALGRIVMATRERILALEPRGKGILAYTIRSEAEVRKPDEIFAGISDAKADPAMISIAEKIIEQREGPFDPSTFVDRYEEALRALIDERTKGHKPAKVAEPEETNVVDLMSALRASLAGREKGGAAKPQATKAAPGKARKRKAG